MDDQSALAPEAGPEVVTPETAAETPLEGQEAETQAPEAEAEPEGEAKEKSKAAERRERERALKARLIAERDAAMAEAERERARADRLKQAAAADTPPTEAEFADPIEYAAVKAAWYAQQKMFGRELAEAEAAERAAQERALAIDAAEEREAAATFKARADEARKRYADFDAVIGDTTLPIPKEVALALATMENGPDVAYHLGKNRELAAELAHLSRRNPAAVGVRLALLGQSLNIPQPRKETAAPPPISPVRGNARPVLNPDSMSYAEYRAARKAGKIK